MEARRLEFNEVVRNTGVHNPEGGRFPHKLPGKEHNYFGLLTGSNDIICLQEIHGKDEFLHALQITAPRFKLFGTFIPNNANAGGSAICIPKDLLLVDDASVVTIS